MKTTNKDNMKTMKDLLIQLKEVGIEEKKFGNSKEKCFGEGVIYAINKIKKYCKKNNIKLDI
tara:strand:+ start:439 stop:624 length:186 start_codon:yes stop_codon:yes gene_type:complete